jgi:hypothetical protein
MAMNALLKIFRIGIIFAFCGTAVAQFRAVPYGSGVARVSTEAIVGSFAVAGGGVVLRGVASCSGPSDNCAVKAVHINSSSASDDATLEITSPKCSVPYTAPSWMISDSIALVSSETSTITRNVNLLGDPTPAEINSRPNIEEYFTVEVSRSLIGRKAGEVLIAVDLMLTDPQFYSGFKIHRASDTVGPTGPSAPNLSTTVKAYMTAADSLAREFVNWTWNDENSGYRYEIQCGSNKLSLTGLPTYTFLDDGGALNAEATKYFQENYKVVLNLNPEVYGNAIKFAQISAFLRSLRRERPLIWHELQQAAQSMPMSHGSTPRLVARE